MMTSLVVALAVGAASFGGAANATTFEHVSYQVPDAPYQSMLGQRPGLLDQMTREQLVRERDRLDAETPGLAGPIVLISAGAGSLLVGIYYLVGSTIPSVYVGYGSSMFLALGLITLSAGIACGVFGALWLVSRLNERAVYKERVAAIDARLDSVYAPGGPNDYSPPPLMVPPPPPPPGAPPPPPPASLGEVPPASMLVAEF